MASHLELYGSSYYSFRTTKGCTAKCAGGANGMNPWDLNFMANFTKIGTYEYKYGEPDVPAYRVKQWVGSFPGYGKNDTGWPLFCDDDAAGSTACRSVWSTSTSLFGTRKSRTLRKSPWATCLQARSPFLQNAAR